MSIAAPPAQSFIGSFHKAYYLADSGSLQGTICQPKAYGEIELPPSPAALMPEQRNKHDMALQHMHSAYKSTLAPLYKINSVMNLENDTAVEGLYNHHSWINPPPASDLLDRAELAGEKVVATLIDSLISCLEFMAEKINSIVKLDINLDDEVRDMDGEQGVVYFSYKKFFITLRDTMRNVEKAIFDHGEDSLAQFLNDAQKEVLEPAKERLGRAFAGLSSLLE